MPKGKRKGNIMNTPKNLQYTKSHEWVEKIGENKVRIGLTDYAQSQLGDIVFVNLPQEGDEITVEQSFADVESVKAVSDIYSPVTGTVVAINEELLDAPEGINSQPYEAWLVEVENVSAYDEMLTDEQYIAICE